MKTIFLLLGAGGLIYAGLCTLMWWAQDSMIFLSQPAAPQSVQWARELGAQETIAVNQGTRLSGWFRAATGHRRAPLLLYFGGNAEEVTGMLSELQRYPEYHVALFNYRGYGASEGAPSESALLADSVMLYDFLAARPEVAPDAIALIGRSLGSGVVCHLAARRATRAVVLISPFDSLEAVARRAYPMFPVRWLLRHPFDSMTHAPAIAAPVLALAGTHDRIVPLSHSQRLLDQWRGQTHLERLEGADHNDVLEHPKFWPATDAFLRTHLGAPVSSTRPWPAP